MRTYAGFAAAVWIAARSIGVAQIAPPSPHAVARTPEEWLVSTLRRFHDRFDVYSDAFAAGNHFPARALIYGGGARTITAEQTAEAVPPMDEDYRCPSRPGTCIRATFRPRGRDWGGWYFMNGVFPDPATNGPVVTAKGIGSEPGLNWGTIPGAGADLSGATVLSFSAAGAEGGEVIDFFAFGVGRDERGRPLRDSPYPDSSARVPLPGRIVKLTRSWARYTIDLTNKPLNYVLGGFGWVADATRNRRNDVVFYIDDISFDKARPDEPRLPLSYETIESSDDFDVVARNVAYTYDAAVALIAFVAIGDLADAKLIADALLHAQQNDRSYTDGRIRNAYQAGDLVLPPGWLPNGRSGTVRMPGWYISKPDGAKWPKRGWYEDRFNVSTHTGNVAWTMLGLLTYYEATAKRLSSQERRPYLDGVIRLATWLDDPGGCGCRDPRSGYTGGWDGWEGATTKLQYRATEHNLDLVAAFERLGRATGDARWVENSEHARKFVDSTWDGKKYRTGTLGDGDGFNEGVIPVDAQAWAVLALRDRAHREGLAFAEQNLRAEPNAFPFSNVDQTGIWYEGTAHMALVYRLTGQSARAEELLQVIRSARYPSGAIPAASKDGLRTGFNVFERVEWHLFRRAHTGATAWTILAERGFNPFATAPAQ